MATLAAPAQREALDAVDAAYAAAPLGVQLFVGSYDDTYVHVYQAFNTDIADYAVAQQTFVGCPAFNTRRMTWIKPSFAWVCYRSGYGRKHGQERVLRLSLPHDAMGSLLSQCRLVDTNKATRSSHGSGIRPVRGGCRRPDDDSGEEEDDSGEDEGPVGSDAGGGGGGTTVGRVQWDPARDLYAAAENRREPRAMLRQRAIQIGLPGRLSAEYTAAIAKIDDITPLARALGQAHAAKTSKDFARRMRDVAPQLPVERPYAPRCARAVLAELAMLPGPAADAIACLGRGKATAAAAPR